MEDPLISETIRKREEVIRRILDRQDPSLIKRGVEAYRRDLPSLLEHHKQQQLVAYRGDKQIAIAPDYRKLDRILMKKGFGNDENVFVTSIVPLPDDGDDQRGR